MLSLSRIIDPGVYLVKPIRPLPVRDASGWVAALEGVFAADLDSRPVRVGTSMTGVVSPSDGRAEVEDGKLVVVEKVRSSTTGTTLAADGGSTVGCGLGNCLTRHAGVFLWFAVIYTPIVSLVFVGEELFPRPTCCSNVDVCGRKNFELWASRLDFIVEELTRAVFTSCDMTGFKFTVSAKSPLESGNESLKSSSRSSKGGKEEDGVVMLCIAVCAKDIFIHIILQEPMMRLQT